ncbi:unnamed protein product, partial [Amoebophrya sp. A25]
SFFLLDTLCAETPDDFFYKLKNVMLHLEGLFFYVDADSEVRQEFGAKGVEMGRAIHDRVGKSSSGKQSKDNKEHGDATTDDEATDSHQAYLSAVYGGGDTTAAIERRKQGSRDTASDPG